MNRFSIFLLGAVFGAGCVAFLWYADRPVSPLTPPAGPTPSLPANVQSVVTSVPPASINRTILEPVVPPISDLSIPVTTAPNLSVAPATGSSIETPAAPLPSSLLIPVKDVAASSLVDTFTDSRSEGRVHDAIDIMAARGTAVVAAGDGKIAKLFTSKQGGLTVYEFDPGTTYAYYYAHLDRYAPGIIEGREVRRGDLIGYVGSTGNASPDAPHLHFAIFLLGPEKNWWQGTAINPYPLLSGKH